jgi:hypothetical protein
MSAAPNSGGQNMRMLRLKCDRLWHLESSRLNGDETYLIFAALDRECLTFWPLGKIAKVADGIRGIGAADAV